MLTEKMLVVSKVGRLASTTAAETVATKELLMG